jgi:glycosyltransferase involved in cell wall biosynthesis
MTADPVRRKIRVAMVILEYAPIIGGAQRQLALLAPYLKALDVEVTVLTRRYPGLAPFEILDGVRVHRLPAPGPKALASLIYTAASLRQLGSLKPDLVHAFSLFSPLTTAVAYKRFSRTPVVVKILRGGRLGDMFRLQHKFLGVRRLADFRRSVDTFISISQEISDELEAAQIAESKISYIPNGVDTDHFQLVTPEVKRKIRKQLDLPPGPLVVFTGRLVPEKGVGLLLDAWSSVRRSYPEAVLVIVGEGDLRGQLQEGAEDGVYFTGGVEDVRPYLQSADLFILPSSDEGLSNAMLEGMAAGLGVIATEVGGAPDLIKHQENGWLIPPGEVGAISDSITSLLDAPGAVRKMGLAARQTVLESYALPVVAQKLRELYDSHLI